MKVSLAQRLAAEWIGTAFLVAAAVGSGIMSERLSGGNVALALLTNTIATGAALVALILALGPISGAHFNPVVTLSDAWLGATPWRETPAYIAFQMFGGISGTFAAHLMFRLPIISLSHHVRSGAAQVLSEFIATFGLVLIILCCSRLRFGVTAFAVGSYIAAAYWFTASTSFANPAVTIARSLSDTFSGIRPADSPGFIAAQLVGGFAAALIFGWLASGSRFKGSALSNDAT